MFSASRLFSGKILAAATAVTVGSNLTSLALVTRCLDQENSKTNATNKAKARIVVVGGGTAGIGMAALLQREGIKNVTLIEPKTVHYYQPLWTLVGGGVKSNTASVKPMETILPKGTKWLAQSVTKFSPETNRVTLDNGTVVDYDYLVVAAGIQSNWNTVPGVLEGLQNKDSGVVSVYHYDYCAKTWNEFQSLVVNNSKSEKSKLLFTMPPTPIKCAGAPQKIMWLLEDTLRHKGLRDKADIQFWVPGPSMFGIKYYSDKLEAIRQERGVVGKFRHELVKVDVANKVATFKNLDKANELVTVGYNLIHVVPHMSPPDFIKSSPLADSAGWMQVDQYTLQSPKYPNVFGLGDCTSTPNSKTAAAVTAQAPVVVYNLERAMERTNLDGKYNGYASCPLIIARNKVILAEFGYGGKIMETFGWTTGEFPYYLIGTEGALQQRFFYFLKEQFFPYVYWNLWTRGWWFGTHGPFKPNVRDTDKK